MELLYGHRYQLSQAHAMQCARTQVLLVSVFPLTTVLVANTTMDMPTELCKVHYWLVISHYGAELILFQSNVFISDKIDAQHVYTEVYFAIGSQFIRHALDDSEPIAHLQGNKKRVPYFQVWSNTGYSVEQQLMNKHMKLEYTQDCGVQPTVYLGQPLSRCKCRLSEESEEIWAALNIEVLRADEGEVRSPRKPADQRHCPARIPLAKIRNEPDEDLIRFALVGGEQSNHSATAVPENVKYPRIRNGTKLGTSLSTSRVRPHLQEDPAARFLAYDAGPIADLQEKKKTSAILLGVKKEEKKEKENERNEGEKRRKKHHEYCCYLKKEEKVFPSSFIFTCSLTANFMCSTLEEFFYRENWVSRVVWPNVLFLYTISGPPVAQLVAGALEALVSNPGQGMADSLGNKLDSAILCVTQAPVTYSLGDAPVLPQTMWHEIRTLFSNCRDRISCNSVENKTDILNQTETNASMQETVKVTLPQKDTAVFQFNRPVAELCYGCGRVAKQRAIFRPTTTVRTYIAEVPAAGVVMIPKARVSADGVVTGATQVVHADPHGAIRRGRRLVGHAKCLGAPVITDTRRRARLRKMQNLGTFTLHSNLPGGPRRPGRFSPETEQPSRKYRVIFVAADQTPRRTLACLLPLAENLYGTPHRRFQPVADGSTVEQSIYSRENTQVNHASQLAVANENTTCSHIWAALTIEILKCDEGEARRVWDSTGMQGRTKRRVPRENAPTSGIVRHDSSIRKIRGATPPEIEPVSTWCRLHPQTPVKWLRWQAKLRNAFRHSGPGNLVYSPAGSLANREPYRNTQSTVNQTQGPFLENLGQPIIDLWLDYLPPTKANRDRFPGGVAPGFSLVKIVPTTPLVGRFSRDIPFSPPFHSNAASYSPPLHLHRLSKHRCKVGNTKSKYRRAVFFSPHSPACKERSRMRSDESLVSSSDDIARSLPSLRGTCQPRPSLLDIPSADHFTRCSSSIARNSATHSFIHSNSTLGRRPVAIFIVSRLSIWKAQYTPSHAEITSALQIHGQLKQHGCKSPVLTNDCMTIGSTLTTSTHVGIDAVGWPVFSRISRYPAILFRCCYILASITLIGSQDLDVESRPNLFTHSLLTHNIETVKIAPNKLNLLQIPSNYSTRTSKILVIALVSGVHGLNSDFYRFLMTCTGLAVKPYEVSIEWHRNARWRKWEIYEKTRRPSASPGTITHMRKYGSDRAGDQTWFAVWTRRLNELNQLRMKCEEDCVVSSLRVSENEGLSGSLVRSSKAVFTIERSVVSSSSAYWRHSCVFIGYWLAPGSYGIRKVFLCKSTIGSEAYRASLINCNPIAKDNRWQHGMCRGRPASKHRSIVKTHNARRWQPESDETLYCEKPLKRNLIYTVQRYDGKTALQARRSDEALRARVRVARRELSDSARAGHENTSRPSCDSLHQGEQPPEGRYTVVKQLSGAVRLQQPCSACRVHKLCGTEIQPDGYGAARECQCGGKREIDRHDSHAKIQELLRWGSNPVRLAGHASKKTPVVNNNLVVPFANQHLITNLQVSSPSNKESFAAPIQSRILFGAAVAERLDCSLPTEVNRIQYPAGSLPDFRKWKSCRTMLLVSGFSQGSPVSPHLCTPALLHSPIISPSSAPKTPFSRAVQISHLTSRIFFTPESMQFLVNAGHLDVLEPGEDSRFEGPGRWSGHVWRSGAGRAIEAAFNRAAGEALLASRPLLPPPLPLAPSHHASHARPRPQNKPSVQRRNRPRASPTFSRTLQEYGGASPAIGCSRSAGTKARGERGIPHCPPRFPHAEDPVATPRGIEPGSPRWQASSLTTTPPRPRVTNYRISMYQQLQMACPHSSGVGWPTCGRRVAGSRPGASDAAYTQLDCRTGNSSKPLSHSVAIQVIYVRNSVELVNCLMYV
ncbi:hypothetical protein PR048_030597 [Dryococelus australis]|uniref:Uncharacterized protein n=1 Tax=Dryococelus australis TaxID=614101 RepID=A0ABQ9G9G5_9NEOP|nr:hypothetical protein PR048_030597 [Dryococelus australis]